MVRILVLNVHLVHERDKQVVHLFQSTGVSKKKKKKKKQTGACIASVKSSGLVGYRGSNRKGVKFMYMYIRSFKLAVVIKTFLLNELSLHY